VAKTGQFQKLGKDFYERMPKKKEKKKSTSEVINKIIPHFKPLTTLDVCKP